MDWDEAVEEAKGTLGILGYCSPEDWESVMDEARAILSMEASIEGRERHKDYLKSDEWKKRRGEVLERDNFICQECLKIFPEVLKEFKLIPHNIINFRKRAEEVHHESYINVQTPDEIYDCVSLCEHCHGLRHATTTVHTNSLKEKREENIYLGIYREILTQTWCKKELEKQHKNFIKSITIKPNDLLNGEVKEESEKWNNP